MNQKWIDKHTIHRIVAGSHLYGTAKPDSDIDVRGVCLGPIETLLGLTQFEQYQPSGEDTVIYELRRFCHLALNANPNILDLLMAPEIVWQVTTPQWTNIWLYRHEFLSQKVRHTFSGYAISQLKRIKAHRRWLQNPPTHIPTQEEFGGKWDGSTYQFKRVADEKAYRAALHEWNNFLKWQENRNPTRAELERKYGYDTKHASHLVRLMLQAIKLLRTRTYNPRLAGHDLDTVLEVQNGEWTYQQLIEFAERLDLAVQIEPTHLPKTPNRALVENLCITTYSDFLLKKPI